MTFTQSIKSVLTNYTNFTGRASRSEFWYFALLMVIIYWLIFLIGGHNSNGGPSVLASILIGIAWLATLLPILAVSVRRMHDTGRGGGWIFISLVPCIGTIWYIVLAALPSEQGSNRFGPMPES